MQQQVQINQSPERVLTDAAAFFAKRRTKITDRDPKGFRFGLEGADAREGGRVTVASGPGGGSTVTVQADGLGVMAIAEGFVRELRKHARSVDRRARTPARDVARGGFGDLRERLGMPEPVAQQRPPRGAAPAEPTARAPSDAAADAGPAAPREAAEAAAPPPAAAPAVAGMSLSATSTVPPSDWRKAVSAHSSERLSAIGGLSTAGMIGG
jgi:hypothetical protein